MLYAILGLMIGSLYAIVMGPTTLPEPAAALSVGNFNLITAAVGMAVVLLLDKVVN